jgi:hypothetical protein
VTFFMGQSNIMGNDVMRVGDAETLDDAIAIHVAAHNAKLASAAKLRASFAFTLSRLGLDRLGKPFPGVPEIDSFLLESLPGHAAAVEEYRTFVPEGKMMDYQEAWKQYCETATTGLLFSGAHAGGMKDALGVVREKIYAILSFATI